MNHLILDDLALKYNFEKDEFYKNIRILCNLDKKLNNTSNNLAYLWTMYNLDPPRPPYDYDFETKDEAIDFAERAKEKHNVDCDINFYKDRWKLTSDKI